MNFTHKLTRITVSGALAATMLLPNALAMYQAQVKADALYLREAPDGAIITTLSDGTPLAVLDNSSSWYKVAVDGKEGYVSGEFLIGTTATDFSLGEGKIVCDTTVNFRSAPNTSSTVLCSLSNGMVVSVTGVQDGWYKVNCNGQDGFVHPDYLSFAAESAAPSTGKIVCDTTVNLRAEPNTSSTVLASMTNGTVVHVTGTQNSWYQITYNGKAGFVHPDYLTLLNEDGTPVAITPSANAVSYTGSSEKRASVLDFAAQYLGTPYVYGGSTPSGFDCSGFTSYVFKNTVGTIPRVAQSQFNATTRVSRGDLEPGDLVFFGSSASSISHVGIYVGGDQFIHSPHTGDVVKYDSLSGSYANRFQGGGRVIFD
ncbi:MAG: SH3 domain-containing protein [Eubacteriales bacterium]|nr:SH3 domain-containing protein [Eubacteriales bacterium]